MKNIFRKIIVYILEWEARILVKRLRPKIIAVAGSVGKTSTKDAIYTALVPYVSVRKSDKSFNSEIGLPLTILDLPNAWGNPLKWLENICKGLFYAFFMKDYPEYLVLEVGSDRPGDIERVVSWLPIHAAVLTRMPDIPVHVEFFKDGHAVNEEDKKILKAIQKGGIIISNADDSYMSDVKARYPHAEHVTYGVSGSAAVSVQDITYTYAESGEPTGIMFTVISHSLSASQSMPLSIAGVVGMQHVYPFLAALAVVRGLRLDLGMASQALMTHSAPKGRMRIIEGVSGVTIIDDTYNSSPVAVEEALKALKKLETKGKKIAILGDMLELGIHTEREHRRIGSMIAECVDVLVTVGQRSEDFGNGAVEAGFDKNHIHMYKDALEALAYIQKHAAQGDIILVKGSQGVRMERIVAGLMKDADKAKDMLVRQEKEWESR